MDTVVEVSQDIAEVIMEVTVVALLVDIQEPVVAMQVHTKDTPVQASARKDMAHHLLVRNINAIILL